MCLYPKIFRNPKFKENVKNGGNIPPIRDKRTLYIAAGCGNCKECLEQKANNWRIRLMEEIKKAEHRGWFITLTFNDDEYTKLLAEAHEKGIRGYTADNWIATRAVRLFTERWRKRTKRTIRHWLVTELGHEGTENVHLHGIVWTEEPHMIAKTWAYGYMWPRDNDFRDNYVSEQTINYICKYVTKQDADHPGYRPVILSSKGMGAGYVSSYNAKRNRKGKPGETDEAYTTREGHKIGLPMYYRNKIYTEKEREDLWIERLDRQVRYVDKIEIDVSRGYEEYFLAVVEARKKYKDLGYLGHRRSEEDIEYENKVRELKQLERDKKKKIEVSDKEGLKRYDREKKEYLTGEDIIMNYRKMDEWMERKIKIDRLTGWDDI